VRVENLDFEWWSRSTALILLGSFVFEGSEEGFCVGLLLLLLGFGEKPLRRFVAGVEGLRETKRRTSFFFPLSS
jgi:hypothetical protein